MHAWFSRSVFRGIEEQGHGALILVFCSIQFSDQARNVGTLNRELFGSGNELKKCNGFLFFFPFSAFFLGFGGFVILEIHLLMKKGLPRKYLLVGRKIGRRATIWSRSSNVAGACQVTNSLPC